MDNVIALVCDKSTLFDKASLVAAQVSLEAVSKANVSMSQVAQTHPVINLIEDLSTHRSDNSLTPAKPVRITGRRLKIAGDAGATGLYFAPQDDQGVIDETEADWIRLEDGAFFKNTDTFLEFIFPHTLSADTSYTLVIKTASGRGKAVNKTITINRI